MPNFWAEKRRQKILTFVNSQLHSDQNKTHDKWHIKGFGGAPQLSETQIPSIYLPWISTTRSCHGPRWLSEHQSDLLQATGRRGGGKWHIPASYIPLEEAGLEVPPNNFYSYLKKKLIVWLCTHRWKGRWKSSPLPGCFCTLREYEDHLLKRKEDKQFYCIISICSSNLLHIIICSAFFHPRRLTNTNCLIRTPLPSVCQLELANRTNRKAEGQV